STVRSTTPTWHTSNTAGADAAGAGTPSSSVLPKVLLLPSVGRVESGQRLAGAARAAMASSVAREEVGGGMAVPDKIQGKPRIVATSGRRHPRRGAPPPHVFQPTRQEVTRLVGVVLRAHERARPALHGQRVVRPPAVAGRYRGVARARADAGGQGHHRR